LRYINNSLIPVSDNWLEQAEEAAAAIAKGSDPNDFSNVWRVLKSELAKLSNGKCWFCESPVDRSDNAVDHFRPKGRVSDATNKHDGYRWLAFERLNFRYACTYCNSKRNGIEGRTVGGKADRFPLVNEASRVYSKGPVDQEQPMLLDPCELTDWRLLGCRHENGKPCTATSDPTSRERAEVSIEVYHLHHEATCNRRHAIAVQLISDIDDAKRLFKLSTQDASKAVDFKKIARRLQQTISREAPYSGDMHFLMRGQRSEADPWIQELLEN
jgi:hypothetical protein